jgi:hypothetical protein
VIFTVQNLQRREYILISQTLHRSPSKMTLHTRHRTKIITSSQFILKDHSVWVVLSCHSSWVSYYNLRVIRVQLSDNPYPLDFANTKLYSVYPHNRIRINHIRMGIKNSLLYPWKSNSGRIGCENYPHHFSSLFLSFILVLLQYIWSRLKSYKN